MIEVTENLHFHCEEKREGDDGGMEKIKLEVSAYINHREVDVEMSSNGSEPITISLDRCAASMKGNEEVRGNEVRSRVNRRIYGNRDSGYIRGGFILS